MVPPKLRNELRRLKPLTPVLRHRSSQQGSGVASAAGHAPFSQGAHSLNTEQAVLPVNAIFYCFTV